MRLSAHSLRPLITRTFLSSRPELMLASLHSYLIPSSYLTHIPQYTVPCHTASPFILLSFHTLKAHTRTQLTHPQQYTYSSQVSKYGSGRQFAAPHLVLHTPLPALQYSQLSAPSQLTPQPFTLSHPQLTIPNLLTQAGILLPCLQDAFPLSC